LLLAKLLDQSALKVLLLEKRQDLRKLSNHQYGTFKETVKKFSLEKYTIKKLSKFGFYGSRHGTCYSYQADSFQVVDMNKFVADLELNCEIRSNYTVRDIKYKGNKLVLDGQMEAAIVADCSGDQQVVLRALNLLKRNPIHMFSTSYELTNCNISKNKLAEFCFMADSRYTNVGLWFYPYSKTTCQIGQTDFYSPQIPLIKNQRKSLDMFIRDIEPYKSWLKDAKIVETVRKTGPTTTLSTCYGNNFIVCGDAAGAGTPLVGEGFRIALEMALSGQKTILKAFKCRDFSKRTLKQHQRTFYKQSGKYYAWSSLLRHLILHYFSNREYDNFARDLRKLSAADFRLALKSEFTLPILIKPLRLRTFLGILSHLFHKPVNKRIVK